MTVKTEKKEAVKIIKDKFSKAKGVIVTDYRGLSVKAISDLRGKLREAGIEYKVYKNTLAKIAVEGESFESVADFMQGPTAYAFDFENEVEAAKVLSDFAKEQDNLEIKGGIIEGQIVDVKAVKQYAALPSKDELIAKALGTISAPVRQMVTVVAAPVQGFINVLKAKAEQG